jgi:hypothetical protein
MTRGRDDNTAHLVANTTEEARNQWVSIFDHDRADLGPGAAADAAAEAIERYGPRRPIEPMPRHPTPYPSPARPAPARGIDR